MSIEIFVIIVGLVLAAVLVNIIFGGKGDKYESDTVSNYNGKSYHSSRTTKYDRYG